MFYDNKTFKEHSAKAFQEALISLCDFIDYRLGEIRTSEINRLHYDRLDSMITPLFPLLGLISNMIDLIDCEKEQNDFKRRSTLMLSMFHITKQRINALRFETDDLNCQCMNDAFQENANSILSIDYSLEHTTNEDYMNELMEKLLAFDFNANLEEAYSEYAKINLKNSDSMDELRSFIKDQINPTTMKDSMLEVLDNPEFVKTLIEHLSDPELKKTFIEKFSKLEVK